MRARALNTVAMSQPPHRFTSTYSRGQWRLRQWLRCQSLTRFASRCIPYQARWVTSSDLCGIELIENLGRGLPHPVTGSLYDLDRGGVLHGAGPTGHVRDRVTSSVHPMRGTHHEGNRFGLHLTNPAMPRCVRIIRSVEHHMRQLMREL